MYILCIVIKIINSKKIIFIYVYVFFVLNNNKKEKLKVAEIRNLQKMDELSTLFIYIFSGTIVDKLLIIQISRQNVINNFIKNLWLFLHMNGFRIMMQLYHFNLIPYYQ